MAYNQVDYLQNVALDGFAMIEERYGRGSLQRHTPPVPTMAPYNQVDYLQKVALDGFAIVEERYGRGFLQRQTPLLPPPGRQQDQYHNHQKPPPNQYCYQEPDQDYVTPKEPASFRTYRPPTKHSYETWYFLPVSQAPKQEGAVISSKQAAENYGGILFKDYGYKSKPYRWG